MEKYEDARRFYRNALGQGLAHAGRDGMLNALLAQCQDSLDRGSFEEAYSVSSEALALAPQDSRFSEIRCSALEGMGKTDDALSCYDQVLSSGQWSAKAKEAKSLLLTRLGQEELAAGNVSLALEWLEQARLLDPQNQDAAQFQAKALSRRGDLLYKDGQYALAAESYEAALAFSSNEPSALEGKRKALEALSSLSRSNDSADLARENKLEKESSPEKKLESSESARYLEMAEEYMGRGSISSALQSVNRSLQADMGREDAWLLQSEILLSLGNNSQS
ncbi:MAG: hypothetical protein LUQ15_01455, partial [Methanothrix sp.]